jgi:hypothetical protein
MRLSTRILYPLLDRITDSARQARQKTPANQARALPGHQGRALGWFVRSKLSLRRCGGTIASVWPPASRGIRACVDIGLRELTRPQPWRNLRMSRVACGTITHVTLSKDCRLPTSATHAGASGRAGARDCGKRDGRAWWQS